MLTHRILVIGSKNHSRAECFDWLQPLPNVEEYDALIINMQSMTQQIFDQIVDKIRELAESICTVINTDREIFCVFSNVMNPSPPPRRPGEGFVRIVNTAYTPPSNYDWLPSYIFLNDKSGDYIQLVQNRFAGYFKLIKKWNWEIGLGQTPAPRMDKSLNCLAPIATNKSEKCVAASLWQSNDRKKLLEEHKIGMVHLLPPVEEADSYEAIERIIDIIAGPAEKMIVPWRNQIEIPQERYLKESVDVKVQEIEKIQKEILQIEQQLKEWDSYRDLLTETGERLENIVKKALVDLGFDIRKTEKGFPADLQNKELVVEITGIKGCIGAGSNKVAQIGRFAENFRKNEKIVLIVNTYMDESPKERKDKMDFSPEMTKYLESLSVCFMTTQTLFDFWKKVIEKKTEARKIREKILSNVGELSA